VLFASTPSSPSHFAARGIPLLVEAARLRPDVDFVLLWRQWGSQSAAESAFQALRPSANVVIQHGDVQDMAAAYQAAHATIWLAEDGYGKSCPNSVIEGLACGRPAVVSSSCGIADLIVGHGAGVAPLRDPAGVAAAIRQLTERHQTFCENARTLAVRHFGMESFIQGYAHAYREVLDGRMAPASASSGVHAQGRVRSRPRPAVTVVPAD
jgi:glycosyltransferase involved in cell wall biosynthesis